MTYNGIDAPYTEPTCDQNYPILPYSKQSDDFYPYFSEDGYSYLNLGAEEPSLAAAEVSSSSDIKNGQTDHSPTEDDLDMKKQLRRLQNREAASRCRRKKMERISLLRQTLNSMYNRCQELMQNINAVEAEVRTLKAAGYGQHLSYAQYQAMKNGAFEEPMPDIYPRLTVPDRNQPDIENQFEVDEEDTYQIL